LAGQKRERFTGRPPSDQGQIALARSPGRLEVEVEVLGVGVEAHRHQLLRLPLEIVALEDVG
jgi:hypothetical protein